MAAAAIKTGVQEKLYLGNLDSKRDWGYAKEYVEGMWMMLQQDKPDDFVLATGETHSIRECCEVAFGELGVELVWKGSGADEKGYDKKTDRCLIEVDSRYFRPTEVELLLGDASKAKKVLGWQPKTTFKELITMMVKSDYNLFSNKKQITY
jgi:GDPmannose 4,6-dehydratase